MRRWVGMTVGAILMVSSAQAGTNTVATLADSGVKQTGTPLRRAM